MSDPVLPQSPISLAKNLVPTGVHRRWLKVLVFGDWKSGKSTFLADFLADVHAYKTPVIDVGSDRQDDAGVAILDSGLGDGVVSCGGKRGACHG